jgi:flagellar hook protein FlgE
MMRSLYAAISGLRNHQTKMDVIGNNIANVNTVGFKSGSVTFQDMLSQTLSGASSGSGNSGGTNAMQVGLGVSVASINTNFTDGSTQSTGVQTDLAITGQGFFVVGDALNQQYTRSGNFTFDALGNFVNGNGVKVLGWQANSSGVVDTTGPIAGITVPVGSSMPAKVSSTLSVIGNLSASANALGTAAGVQSATTVLTGAHMTTATTDATASVTAAPAGVAKTAATTAQSSLATASASATAANTAATNYPATTTAAALQAATAKALADAETAVKDAETAVATTGSVAAAATALASAKAVLADAKAANVAALALTDHSSDQPASLNVYDTQGNAYKLSGTFEKTGANQWSFTPSATITNANGVTLANVTTTAPIVLAFNANGSINTASSTLSNIKIDPTTVTPPSPYVGGGAFTITPDFSTMTQYGTDTTAKIDSTDGYTAGTLTAGGGITISSDGTIVGSFTNGKKMNLGQVAMANFNNPGGLIKSGDSLYSTSSNSGQAQVGKAGTGGRGSLTPGSLEMSNVDLAQQFSDMIVTQRGFQANSKIITTDDSMLEELVNLKR